MIRETFVQINEDVLNNNVKDIIKNYSNYKYFIGIVKNNAYHHGWHIANSLIDGGINYLAVATAEEAISIRKYNNDVPILCLEPISLDNIDKVIDNKITLTVDNLNYVKYLANKTEGNKINIHIKIDSGMNRLGFTKPEDLTSAIDLIKSHDDLFLEGIYTHLATSGVLDKIYDNQITKFLEITKDVNLSEVPMVHVGRSLTMVQHDKPDFCNTIRVGIAMYGFSQSKSKNTSLSIMEKLKELKHKRTKAKYNISDTHLSNNLDLNTAMSLYSVIISKRAVKVGDFVGYGATYKIENDGYIYTIPIGFADGVNCDFKKVSINNIKCNIVADSMDMIMVFSKNEFEIGTKVEIFGQEITIRDVCNTLGINAYKLFNRITNRITYVHKYKNSEEEVIY